MAQDRPRKYFFRVLFKFETFFSKICTHSERYRNRLAGIFEIINFKGNIAVPLSPVELVLLAGFELTSSGSKSAS